MSFLNFFVKVPDRRAKFFCKKSLKEDVSWQDIVNLLISSTARAHKT
jgi:hypothetical protein